MRCGFVDWILAIFLCDALKYLILVFVVVVFLFEAHRVSIVLSLGVEGVDDDLLGALNLGAAERTALKRRETSN